MEACEHLIDLMLFSQLHGESLARHCLDVVQFGDITGFEFNQLRDNALPCCKLGDCCPQTLDEEISLGFCFAHAKCPFSETVPPVLTDFDKLF